MQGKTYLRDFKSLVIRLYKRFNLEQGNGARSMGLNFLIIRKFRFGRFAPALAVLIGVSPMAFGLKEVVSVRLDPSTIAPGDVFSIYVTAQYDSSNSGGNSDDTYATTQYTLNGSSACINNDNATLGATDVYGPYTVTSPSNLSDGSYSFSVDIFSKNNCANSGQSSASTGPASAILTVSGTNDAPVALSDNASVDEDLSVEIDVLANDTDSDGAIDAASVEISIAPPNGSVSVNTTTGAVTYSGDSDFNGTDQFTYTVADDDGRASEAATVSLTVNWINDPPTATGDRSASVLKGSGYTLTTSDLFYADSDDDAASVTFTVSALTNGTLTVAGSSRITFTGLQIVAGQVVFTHDDSDTTTGGFTVSVEDGNEDSSSPADVSFSLIVVTVDASYAAVLSLFDLSDEPLELVTPSSPNVVVLQDTSSSLNSDLMTEELNGYYPDASAPTRPWNNIYGSGPSPAKQADKESDTPGSGFWRLRNKDYNRLYYNPEIRYQPWAECDGTASAPSGCLSSASPAADLYYYYVWKDTTDAACRTNTEGYVDGTPSPLASPLDACSEGRLVSIKAETGTIGTASAIADLTAFTATGFDDGNALYSKFPAREDCGSANYCTLAEEQANFLNYYTWYRIRGYSMKGSIGKVISEADDNLRIGFAGSNGSNNDVPLDDVAASGQRTALLSGLYSVSYQGNSNFFSSYAKAGEYLACQGQNLFYGSSSSPGDSRCPVLPPPQGSCQQNYILLVTDGGMEGYGSNLGNQSPGDADGDNNTEFDGVIFSGSKPAELGDATLADIAMHYYERDLFSMTDDVVPLARDIALAPGGAFSGGAMHQHVKTFAVAFGTDSGLVDPPTTYSTGSYNWGTSAATPSLLADFLVKDLHHAATNGRGAYLDAQNPDALTAALEAAFSEFSAGLGAGSAVSFNSQEISNGVVLFRSFYNLIENTGDVVAATLNADLTVGAQLWSTASQLDIQLAAGGSGRQIVTYDPSPGAFSKVPFSLSNLTDAQKQSLGWVDAGTDAAVTEKIDYIRGSSANERPSGDFRARPVADGRLGDIINSSPVFVGPPEALFRGGAAYPTGANSYAAFQAAQSRRADRLYVSANDGMLHSIDPANDGNEVFAFIPNATLVNSANTNISELIEPSYSHQYVLDATPVVDDIYITGKQSSKSWRTVLLGAFGAGGKGLFALDVTDPAISESTSSDEVLWEFTDNDDTYPTDSDGSAITTGGAQRVDGSGMPIKDLGLSIDEPVIAMSNVYVAVDDTDLEWIGLLSNGLNSTSGIAKLFGLFIDRGADGTWCHPDARFDDFSDISAGLRGSCDAADYDFIKIDTGAGGYSLGGSIYPNGLGAPRAIDADTDGTVDYVYAGDIQGNLWRFDLCRADLDAWESGDSLSQYDGGAGTCKKGAQIYETWQTTKIFTASYTVSGITTSQPILNKPVVTNAPNDAGYIVIFGTGTYVINGDRNDTDIQSIYGVWDRLGSDTVVKSKLVQQAYTNSCETITEDGTSTTTCGRTLSDNSVVLYESTDSETTPSVLGWFNDLDVAGSGDVAAAPGERAIRNFQIRGDIGFVNSVSPTTSNACSASAGGFGLAFCPLTGGSGCVSGAVFDINNDGAFDASDSINTSVIFGTIFEDSAPTDATFVGENRVTQLTDRSLQIVKTNTASTVNTGRLSWRRLSND